MRRAQSRLLTMNVSPGEILVEALAEKSMTQREFAARTGLSKKHVSEIINAHTGFSPDAALAFERVLGISANFWLSMQDQWKLGRLRARQGLE